MGILTKRIQEVTKSYNPQKLEELEQSDWRRKAAPFPWERGRAGGKKALFQPSSRPIGADGTSVGKVNRQLNC
jgi:hypothetical protein